MATAEETVFRMALATVVSDVTYGMPKALRVDILDHLHRKDAEGLSLCFASPHREWLLGHVLRWADAQRADVGETLRASLREEIERLHHAECTRNEEPSRLLEQSGGLSQQHVFEETRAMILPVESENVNVGRNGTVAMEEVYGLDSQALQELHRQREYMDCVPFNTPMKKLVDAFTCIVRGRVQEAPGEPQVWVVQGSKGDPYRVTTQGCSCPNGQHSHKTRFTCYHAVAAELYQRWQRAMQPSLTLPLPPTTVNERLAAQGAPQPTITPAAVSVAVPVPEPILEAPSVPEEVSMAAPRDAEYIPEPQSADAATAPRVVMPTVVSQEPATAALVRRPETTLAAVALEASLEEWGKQRKVITKYIRDHFVEGTDYYTIKVGGRETKPTLGKPGAEKFLSLFQLQASFRKDEDTWEMLGRPQGVLCYVCTLLTRSGEVVGEGRGCRDIKKDGGDPNKAVKMSQKSAQVDAILRTGALSDAFTQDLDEGLPEPPPAPPAPPVASADDDRKAIAYYLRKLYGLGGGSKEAYETAVLEHTGLRLIPEHYSAIVTKLRALHDEAEAALANR